MIFVGDIANPDSSITVFSERVFEGKLLIANLEGCIIPNGKGKKYSLYNDLSVLQFLKDNNVKAVSLANNHVQDEEDYFEYTEKLLEENGITFFGAGIDKSEEPYASKIIVEDGQTYIFVGYAWIITTIKNKKSRVKINLLENDKIIRDIYNIQQLYPNAKVICFFHWGYELELYPHPMDRKIARNAIDAGAYAVIGCHAHCITGGEIYKGRPIIYGLGNFALCENRFFDGKLKYPAFSHEQLAFEISDKGFFCHWFRNDVENCNIIFEETTAFDSDRMKDKSPYQGMAHEEYKKWFRRNRRKRKLLPVFDDLKNIRLNYIKTEWVLFRGMLLRVLQISGLKGAPK